MKANDYLDDKKPSASSFLDSDQPTGFKTKSLAELLSTYGEPNTLNAGAKVVSGLPGVLEVGARRGYAGIGKVEQGALSILGDLLGSQTLSDASEVVGNRARQIENSAVLRGKNQVGFAPESIVNDVPEAGANAVSSVIQTAPSLLAGALVPGAALPALFGQTFNQEYAQGKDAGLTPLKAAGRAVPMAAFEVAGEKLGGFDRLAEGLRAATRGNGVADLGSAMVSSALKEIPSEEFTTTGQFLTDKAPVIGLNQDATLADYGQQVKDTALTTALQSGAMGAGGRIIQGRNLQAPSVMENIQPEPMPQAQINTPSIIDAISQAVSNVKPSAAEFLDSDTMEAPNVSNATQKPIAGLDSVAPGPELDNGTGSPAIEPARPNANAGGDSAAPNGAVPASDIPDGVTPGESVASVDQQSSNPLQSPVVNDSLTTEQPSNPRQLPKKSKPKANTLLSAIDGLGGIDNKYKWDISGEQKVARGGYNKIFRNASTKTLEQHIENGDLDEFLPYDMHSSVTDDPTAGRDYLADRIRNGDRVLPYDVELEAKQSKVYESEPLQADIESAITDDALDLDTVNALLSEAGYEEREQQTESRYIETEPTNSGGTGQIENTQPESSASGIAGDQGRQAGQTARVQPTAQNEVTGTPGSNEREGTRQHVEAIVRRRAAANQLGKLKPFDNALKLAKDFMAGESVPPAKFKNAATLFANDKPLADAFTALQELAKSPAKESRQNTRSAVDIFTEQINDAKTVDELRNIARNIQMETGVLNDAMAQQLDDMVMERIDAIENGGDLLGNNTEKQQDVADAERAKDEKRNAGTDNASDFVLTGSYGPADQAAARGAQDLFDQKNTESGYEYSKPESIDTPLQGQLNEARKNKESVSKQLKQLRRDYKDAPLGSGRNSLKLDIIRAESKLNEYKNLETDTLNSIEKRANELGKTTIKNKADSAFKRDPMLDAIANIKRQQNQVVDQVQAYVDSITDGWANAPKVTVVFDLYDSKVPQSIVDLNEKQLESGASGVPSAFISGNKVYIVASQMSSKEKVLKAIFHEVLGHYGLRGVYDKPALNAALERIASMRPNKMKKAAKRYGMDVNSPSERLKIAEEVLAEMAETKPEIGVVKQVIAAILAWLRDNIPYFKNLELSDAEIIRDYILPARRYVETGGKEQSASDVAAAFQRSNPQTETETFKKWFGDSKVVDSEGKPLVVYHGTRRQFDAFEPMQPIAAPGNPKAIYFTSDKSEAKEYAADTYGDMDERSRLIPVYLKIENDSDGIIKKRNVRGEDVYEYAVFKPENIKSATANNGNFDPNDSRIAFQRSTEDQPKRSMLRDELGRFKSPTGIIYDKTADIVQTLAQKVAFGQAPKELRTMTRLYKADIQKAMDAASNVVKTMSPMSQLDRALVSDVVEKMVQAGVTPPEHIVNIATGMQNAMDIQTDELVNLGMLSQDSADRWRGKYLPRFYMRENTEGVKAWVGKMLRNSLPVRGIGGNSLKGRGLFEEVNVNEVPKYESLGWEVRDPLWKKNRQGELELVDANKVVSPEKVVVWRDWTPSERAEMGENRDALFRFVMGYTSMQNDIALGRLFDSIAKNQEWTRVRASDGYVKVPDSEIPETGGVKRYGNLAGLYVKKEILDHISQYEESSELWKYYRKALSFWKAGKTVLNPVAHVNNVVSNLTMAHFAGVSYWDAHKYVLAIKDLANNAPMVQEAKDHGLMTGDITRAELMSDMPDDIKEMMQMQESAIKRKASTVFNIITFGLSKPMGKAYRFEDDFFKYLIYRDARKNGLSPDDAVDYATKYIFTYDDLPKGARTVRDLAIPFFAYTYKAVPALTHTLFNYPWRFAAPAAAVWGVNAIAYALAAGDDDDDWQTMYEKGKELEAEERDNLPPWMQGRSALGAQKSIRLGTDEKTQLPVYMDVSRMIPGGDIFDVTNQADGVPIPAPIMPSNPVLTTIAAMFWNKDTFTGKEVTDLNDTGKEAAQKRAEWLLKQLSPAIAPTAYHFDRLAEATALMSDKTVETPWKDYTGYGKDGLPVQGKYAVPQTFGIKARPIDLERSAEISKGQDNKEIRSIMAEIRQAARLLDQKAISQREYDRRVSDAEEKIEAIENK